jgi:RimJ/RimL family protein N-acetyltransferase
VNDCFPILHTDRLTLRPLQPKDADAMAEYRSVPVVARYQSWDAFTREDARRFIEEQLLLGAASPGKWLQLGIIETASGKLAGDCGLLCRQDDPRQTELGITVAPAFQKRGYASEVIGCLITYVFGELKQHRITAVTDEENIAAAALFRRVGFRQEAHFREHVWFKGRWSGELVFALLRSEWLRTSKGDGNLPSSTFPAR